MSDGVLTVSYAVTAPTFPQGSVVDHVLVTCTSQSGSNDQPSQSVAPNAATVTFANLPPDTYTFTAQGFPTTGAGFGTAVSTTLTVTAPVLVSLSLPSALSAAQQ